VFNLHGRETTCGGRDVLSLTGLSVELVVLSDGLLGISEPLGRVTLGGHVTGAEFSHWNELLAVRNAPARWHTLQDAAHFSE